MTDGGSTPQRRTLADWLELAEGYYRDGDVDKAERLLKKLLEAQPRSAHLLNLLGNLCADDGRLDEAVELFRRALNETGPRSALLANLGRCLEERGDLDDALAAFEEAVALDAHNPEARYQLGVTYQRHGRHERAAEAFERAIAAGADHARAHNGLGAALQSLRRLDEAVDCYERALARDPDHAESLNNLAIIHQIKGQHERAIELLRRAVGLQPTSASTQLNLARALIEAERYVEAEPVVERALSLDPELAPSLFAKGQVLEKTGRLEAAHGAYRQALELDRHHLPSRLYAARLARRLVPRWHFPMLNDRERNAAYDAAIAAIVNEGDVVLDIGSGSGLLAMMAARAGAAHVYTCESVPVIAEAARRIVDQNGLSERITVLAKRSTDLVIGADLPKRADVLISEIVDTGLLSEGVVPVVEHAHIELIAEGARVLPRGATVRAMLVQSSALRAQDWVDQAAGFDVSEFNVFADATYAQRDVRAFDHRALTDPFEAFVFDFTAIPILDASLRFDVPVAATGRCDAVVFWFELDLDGTHVVSSAPGSTTSWKQAVQLVEPVELAEGDRVPVTAAHDGNLIAFDVG